jgi:pyroglutamyl-peptidase
MVCVILTGFGKFGGVDENPTELIVNALREKKISVDHFEVLNVAVEDVSKFHDKFDSSEEECLFIHLGVHGSTNCMLLEQCAYNNMTFRIPDQCGFSPDMQCICENVAVDCPLETELDIENVANQLLSEDYNVAISSDPGRFLCNYIYYRSLSRFAERGQKRNAVFIHVPPVSKMNIKDQETFVERTIELLRQCYD